MDRRLVECIHEHQLALRRHDENSQHVEDSTIFHLGNYEHPKLN